MTVAGLILAGGEGTRMGGADKALLRLGPERLVDIAARRLAPQVGSMAIAAGAAERCDPARFAPLSLPVLADPLPGTGPLGGILAGLDWAAEGGADALLTVAVDTPFFPPDLARRLAAGRGMHQIALAATSGETGRLRPHGTFGLWSPACAPVLRTALAKGSRRLADWALAAGAVLVPFPAGEGDPFFNLNRPEELAVARARVTQ